MSGGAQALAVICAIDARGGLEIRCADTRVDIRTYVARRERELGSDAAECDAVGRVDVHTNAATHRIAEAGLMRLTAVLDEPTLHAQPERTAGHQEVVPVETNAGADIDLL